jgi:hypothetical protein
MTDLDRQDRMSELAAKLHALLCMTCCAAGESFRCLNSDIQDEYLWACVDMASELRGLATEKAEVGHG